MMLPDELASKITVQVTHERTNEAVYRQLATILDARNLVAMASFMNKQADGESTHARKFMDYMADRGNICLLEPLPNPLEIAIVRPTAMAVDFFEAAMVLEQDTTRRITALDLIALNIDRQTHSFLDWFLLEQIEEERLLDEIVQRFARSKNLGDEWMDNYIRENMERFFP
jgi:ferritin